MRRVATVRIVRPLRWAAPALGCPSPWSVGVALLSELADARVGWSVACPPPAIGGSERALRWAAPGWFVPPIPPR